MVILTKEKLILLNLNQGFFDLEKFCLICEPI